MKPEKITHIHVDGSLYESPASTTGHSLYELAGVRPEYDLYKEVHGQGDDEFISNGDVSITVKSGDQFYSAKRTLNPGASR